MMIYKEGLLTARDRNLIKLMEGIYSKQGLLTYEFINSDIHLLGKRKLSNHECFIKKALNDREKALDDLVYKKPKPENYTAQLYHRYETTITMIKNGSEIIAEMGSMRMNKVV